MMKKYFFFVSMLLLSVTSCKTSNRIVSSVPQGELPSAERFSPEFKLFWTALADDIASTGATSMVKYKPSEDFARAYGSTFISGRNTISGFLTTSDGAALRLPQKSKIVLSQKSATIYTFVCPLAELQTLVTLEGVVFFELSQPGFPR